MKRSFRCFFNFWHEQLKEKRSTLLKIRKIAEFKSDLLKTNEDIAAESCENWQTFVWWGASLYVDCKTVGFFLKISEEIGKAWGKSLTREAREPHTPTRLSLTGPCQKLIKTVGGSIWVGGCLPYKSNRDAPLKIRIYSIHPRPRGGGRNSQRSWPMNVCVGG